MSSFVVILQGARTGAARTGTKNNQAANETPPFAHADRRAAKSVDGNHIYDVKEHGQVLEQI